MSAENFAGGATEERPKISKKRPKIALLRSVYTERDRERGLAALV